MDWGFFYKKKYLLKGIPIQHTVFDCAKLVFLNTHKNGLESLRDCTGEQIGIPRLYKCHPLARIEIIEIM